MLRWLFRRIDAVRNAARRRLWRPSHALGRLGEDIAHRFLQQRGYVVVERNWTTLSAVGEVDLIAWDDGILVFVEVKSRASSEFGNPERAIDHVKRAAMKAAAIWYCRLLKVPTWRCRYDLITVVFDKPPVVHHYPGRLLTPYRDRVS